MATKKLDKKRKDIRFLVLDVDGVLTDGGMYYTESGDEFKRFNTRDGLGISRLTKSGFSIGLLSSGKNKKLIQSRASLLGVQFVHVGFEAKFPTLDAWRKKLKLTWEEIAYIGDDVNDLEVISYVGFSACPADATDKVKKAADVILKKKGGEGCVREFIERFLMEIQ